MTHRSNVLPRKARPTTKSYRDAIREIVLNLQGAHDLSDAELAERIGCSAGTVKNARNRAGNLDGATLANIEYEFGPGAVDPFLALAGARAVPMGAHCDTDINHALEISEALTAIIATKRPDSPGGEKTTGCEAAMILAPLREARAALEHLILLGEEEMRRRMGDAA